MPNMDAGITPLQGRVIFHQERLFKSAGGNGNKAHATCIERCLAAGLPVLIDTYSDAQCREALRIIEESARTHNMHRARDVRTGWETLQCKPS